MTNTPLRAVLYLRQSTHREESISLELQEHEGRAYAERRGYHVIGVESDPGISGRTWNRPAVQRVMGMIERREADVIVLWKWSRLSRSRLDWAVAADKVQTAGGLIESATEPLDTTTSTGRLARGMLTEFAVFESERMGDVWKETHARRVRNGQPANGKPRFGYRYSRENGFEPDELTGPVLADLYRSYISGLSIYALVKTLNDGAHRPVRGYGVISDGLWGDRTMRRVLDSGFGAGLITHKGELLPGAHEAVITEAEWDAYREARARRRHAGPTERSEYMLSGMVRCVCGSAMNAGQYGTSHTAKYRCKAAHDKRTHTGGYVTASFVEDYAFAWLREREARLRADIDEEAASRPKARAVDHSAAIATKLAAANRRIDALGEKAVTIDMDRDSYQRQLAPMIRERDALQAELLRARVTGPRLAAPLPLDIFARWNDLLVAERREILRRVIDFIEVTPGHPRASFTVHARVV